MFPAVFPIQFPIGVKDSRGTSQSGTPVRCGLPGRLQETGPPHPWTRRPSLALAIDLLAHRRELGVCRGYITG